MSQPSQKSVTPRLRRARWAAGIALVVVAVGIIAVAIPQLRGMVAPTPAPAFLAGVPADDGKLTMLPTGDDAPISSPISISFGRPVPHAAIEQGFALTPATDGQISWHGNTVVFRPNFPGLARGSSYQVKVQLPPDVASAVGASGNQLTYSFTTAEKLAVTSTSPEAGSNEVAFDTPLMVSFSRPVAPLTALSKTTTPLLTLDPPVEGTRSWLTSTIYRFTPAKGWQPATIYRVTVPKTVSDTLGGTLPEDVHWNFVTAGPQVTDTSPRDNTQYVGPQGDITVRFNLPVEKTAAQTAFSLNPRVDGSFTWPDDRTMVFHPGAPYQPTTRYSASAAVSPASSKLTTWSFTTVGAPSVLRTQPTAGSIAEFRPIQITFAHPMDPDSVAEAITVSPPPTDKLRPNWGPDNTEIFVYVSNMKPSTVYTVTLAAGAKDRFGQTLAQPLTFSFTTAPLPAQAGVLRSGAVGTYDADGTLLAPLRIVNTPEVDLQLYRLDRARFTTLATTGSKDRTNLPAEDLVRSWVYTVRDPQPNVTQIVGVPLQDAQGKALPPGYYALRVTPTGATGRGATPPIDVLPLLVSRAHLVVKQADQQALVWAVDIASGQPVAGLPVTLYDRDGTTKLAEGQTNGEGVLQTSIPPQPPFVPGKPRTEITVVAEAMRNGEPALASTTWTGTGAPYQFGIPVQFIRQNIVALAYTDRPLYRPGATVNVKAILRNDHDGKYTLPGGDFKATLVVTEPQGRTIQEIPIGAGGVSLSDTGTFSIQLPLSTEAATGRYNLALAIGDNRVGLDGFTVAEYRAPEFAVTAGPQQKEVVAGDSIAVNVKAGYYFGAVVPDAALRWRVTGRPYDFTLPDDPGWTFDDRDPDPDGRDFLRIGETRASGTGKTGGDGTANFTIPTDLSKDITSQVFTVETTVTDPGNNQEVADRAEVIVHRGDFYLGLRPRSYVATSGDPVAVDLLVATPDRKPAPGMAAAVAIYRRVWNSVKEQDAAGNIRYVSRPEDTLLSTQNVTADKDGRSSVSFTPAEGGLYRFVATRKDTRGNTVRSAVSVWVSGEKFVPWKIEDNDRMELVADKREYRTGDTARILVPSPFPDATALVTVERGTVLSQRVIKLAGNSVTVDIPITEDLLPNAYVGVTLFRGAATTGNDRLTSVYRIGYVTLNVAIASKQLQVKVTPDKAQLAPRETVQYTITTNDSEGKPVAAEVSLALVDSAVLALTDDATPKPVMSFYAKRPLGVSTGGSAAVSSDRFNDSLGIGRDNAQGKGGGGGSTTEDRSDFKATAYWNAAVRTDASGRATVSIPLPDNLTTWRMTAVAATADTRFGTAVNEIVTTKTLLLRPALPRFLVAGDETVIGATVHNGGTRPLDADVTLTADGLTVSGGAQKVQVPAGGDATAQWIVKAGLTATQAKVFLSAQGGGTRDGVEMPLVVKAVNTPEVTATAGTVKDAVDEVVLVPGYVDKTQGELRLQVTPSLAAAVQAASSTLEEKPWEVDCTETTVSRMLPRLAMARAYNKLGVADPVGMGKQLPDIIARAVQRLYNAQNVDGGWGWCAGDVSEPVMTAYAIIGLGAAKKDGYAVDSATLGRAANYLRSYLARPDSATTPTDPNAQALALYALAAAEQGDLARTNLLADKRATLDNDGKALLLLALQQQPGGTDMPVLERLLNDLTGAAVVSATGAHWESLFPANVNPLTLHPFPQWGKGPGIGCKSVRVTALALDALVRTRPGHPLIDNGVRWLLAARREEGRAWASPQETAWSLLALTDVLAAKGDTNVAAGAGYLARLNGRDLAGGKADTDRPLQPDEWTVQIKDLPLDQDNHLAVARSAGAGDGQLYYSMFLRYFPPASLAEAVNRGIGIAREYALATPTLAGSGKREAGSGTGTPNAPASPTLLPVSSVKAGEVVRATMTLVAPADLNFVRVEDFIPAGLEPLDASLKTTSREFADQLRREQTQNRGKGGEALGVPPVFTRPMWSRAEVRDDRVVLLARYLPKGVHTYTYFLRATRPGTYQVPPVQAQETDFPEVWGRSDGSTFRVEGP